MNNMAQPSQTNGRKRVGAQGSLRRLFFGSTEPAAIREKVTAERLRARSVTGASQDILHLTVEELATVLAVSVRTLNRRNAEDGVLDVGEGDRAYRLARIADLATQSIGNRDRAARWLHLRNPALGGETPLEMLRTEVGTHAVERSLYAIAYGGVA